jgi:hypothetical protein
MKTIIIAVVVVVVMIGLLSFKDSNPITYVKETTLEVVEEPKESWMTDEEAIQAAKDVIRKKELQTELTSLKEMQASTTAKIKEVEKELGTY